MEIMDNTEADLVHLRGTIYLVILSGVGHEEIGHKLLELNLQPGQEIEVCVMLLECCSQEKSHNRLYGLLAQRLCLISRVYHSNFEQCFAQQYSARHHLQTCQIRNVATCFGHLLATDALSWEVLAYVSLTEDETTSASRMFVKILFQELGSQLGFTLLKERLSDPAMQESFRSIFLKDRRKNIIFAIVFFTSIGLGCVTEDLRKFLNEI